MSHLNFASAAAAGSNANSARTDTNSTGDWPRRTNGNTQTFRSRTSAAAISSTSQTTASRETPNQSNRNSREGMSGGVYLPPHRNGTSSDSRKYSKDQMLDLFRAMLSSGALPGDISQVAVDGWDPDVSNGVPNSPWNRRDDRDTQVGAEVCWDASGAVRPVNLKDMTAEEKEFFSSVNSPIKPAQNTTKESTPRDTSGRKTSISGVPPSPGGFNLASPNARPGIRRRETNEAYPFPAANPSSNTNSRAFEPYSSKQTPSILRRQTENSKNTELEEEAEKPSKNDKVNPFSGSKRSTTGGVVSNAPSKGSLGTPFTSIGNAFQGFNIPYEADGTARPTINYSVAESREQKLKVAQEKKTQENGSGRSESPKLNQKSSLVGLGGRFFTADAEPTENRSMPKPSIKELNIGSEDLYNAADTSPRSANLGARVAGFGARFGHDTALSHNQTLQTPHKAGSGPGPDDTMSPTDTNPYQSPSNDKEDEYGMQRQNIAALKGFMDTDSSLPGLTGLGVTDRGQTSNGVNRTGLGQINTLPGLGSNPGWFSSQPTAGTPTRERHAGIFGTPFGEGVFSPVEKSTNFPAAFGAEPSVGAAGRGSRLPSYLQQQNPQQDQVSTQLPGLRNEGQSDSFQPGFPALGRNAFNNGALGSLGPPRSNASPFGGSRTAVHDHASASIGATAEASASPIIPDHRQGAHGPFPTQGQYDPPRQPSVQSAGSSQNAPPVRSMCMPDRMRWMYKDSNGQVQGPYSGLEMNDWYKGGYFTPDLLIRKVEDIEFEPLAQLIRRIGNSREPFLVPQLGVAYEPAPGVRGPWNASSTTGVIPPFANAFPTFGTTLSASAQNNLEERKQAEQLLMARQKEQLAQRQYGGPSQIHQQYLGAGAGFQPPLAHQQSTQSLHTQPSYNSMTTAAGFSNHIGTLGQPPISGYSGIVGQPAQGLKDLRAAAVAQSSHGGVVNRSNNAHDDNLIDGFNRFNLGRSGFPAGHDNNHAQQVTSMHHDRAQLQHEQANANDDDHSAFHTADRLQEFQNLQQQRQDEEEIEHSHHVHHGSPQISNLSSMEHNLGKQSITQQVTATLQNQPHAWKRGDHATMQTIVPPPQSSSPMPAPIAQRKHNAVDTLAAGSRSQSQTPSIETPSASIAPWAKEAVEAPKLSLKEIQEAEAKNAAHREQLAAAARRAAAQRELAEQQAAPTPELGLPSTSNWANMPAVGDSNGSPWAHAGEGASKPMAKGKKTLSQIQKEEEARKHKIASAQATVATAGSTQTLSSGKRYADLASKVSSVGPQSGSTAWTTVGASGKVKTPIPAAPAALLRSTSSNVATMATSAPAKPKQPVRSTTLGNSRIGQTDAIAHVKRWAVSQLTGNLNSGVNADNFVDMLFTIGLDDPDIVTEAVHGVSNTLNSRRFADDLVRRRQLAEKGILAQDSTPPPPLPGSSSTGGWNEVAKKGTAASQEPAHSPSNFKVVAAKKKGRKP